MVALTVTFAHGDNRVAAGGLWPLPAESRPACTYPLGQNATRILFHSFSKEGSLCASKPVTNGQVGHVV